MDAALADFFLAAHSDPGNILSDRKINLPEVKIEEGRLVFSIKGLYQLALDQGFIQSDQTYAQFKLNLYQGSINQRLSESGASVVVYKSTGKIKGSWYTLATIE